MTAAKASASNMPFCPPKARPMNISSSVSSVSRNAVLNVFPIEVLTALDGTPDRGIQTSDGEGIQMQSGRARTPVLHCSLADFYCGSLHCAL